jgi:hypothetical protein
MAGADRVTESTVPCTVSVTPPVTLFTVPTASFTGAGAPGTSGTLTDGRSIAPALPTPASEDANAAMTTAAHRR